MIIYSTIMQLSHRPTPLASLFNPQNPSDFDKAIKWYTFYGCIIVKYAIFQFCTTLPNVDAFNINSDSPIYLFWHRNRKTHFSIGRCHISPTAIFTDIDDITRLIIIITIWIIYFLLLIPKQSTPLIILANVDRQFR